jgi:hypothetical protein
VNKEKKMAKSKNIHSGGKVGNAGKTLADGKSTKKEKTKAAEVLNDHKEKKHKEK